MKKLLIPFIVVITASTLFVSCKKTGPAGPAGPAGSAGPQGPTGPIGTANVIYSRWTTGSTWAVDPASNLNFFDINTTSLTQTILSGGSIQVFWAVLGDTVNHVRVLPFAETIGSSVYFHNVKSSVGKLRIETSNFTMSPTNRYRYILIPGGILGGRPDIDWTNYHEIIKWFGVPE